MKILGMLLVVALGGAAWGFVMPDFLSAVVVSMIWGVAVTHFWIKNFGVGA